MRPEAGGQPWPFRIRFSGSGAEYFRIWIVNLLLTLVTIGLYYPWARVRRLRYFYANTWVEHQAGGYPGNGQPGAGYPGSMPGGPPAPEGFALDFHARPKQMLTGTVVMGLAFVVYSIGSQVSPVLATVLALTVGLLTPLVVRAALRFRLANTSWRGLRFGFAGSLWDAYRVYWPIAIPLLLFAASMALVPATPGAPDVEPAGALDGESGAPGWPGLASIGLPLLLFGASAVSGYLILPWLWLRVARYRHSHYVYGSLRSGFKLGFGAVFRMQMRIALVALLVALAAAAGGGVLLWLVGDALLAGASLPLPSTGDGASEVALRPMLFFAIFAGLLFLLSRWIVLPYITAQQQNIAWSATRGPDLAFRSELAFRRLAWLTVRNWFLTLLTLGFYRPFADVAVARLRLEAVSGAFREDPALVIGRERERRSAMGDIGSDLFDLGVGL